MPHYVILEHTWNGVHWDLMLEVGNALRTWALQSLPTVPGIWHQARPLADHRLAYLEYEGPISGDRGTVRRIDRGYYRLIEDQPDRLLIEFDGELFQGTAELAADPECPGSMRIRFCAALQADPSAD